MPKQFYAVFPDDLVEEIETLSGLMLKMPPDGFILFCVLRTLQELQPLKKICKDPDLLEQLHTICMLWFGKRLSDADFVREVKEIASLGADAEFKAEA